MNKRLTMMSVRQLRPLIEELKAERTVMRQRIRSLERQLETCLVTEAGLRDRVAFLAAQLRKEGT